MKSGEEHMNTLKKILDKFPEATDIHFTENGTVMVREGGTLVTAENTDAALLGKEIWDSLSAEKRSVCTKEKVCDASLEESGVRIRVHLYRAGGLFCGALRILPSLDRVEKDPDEDWIEEVADLETGLVIISGPSGSGKSTTLARILTQIGEKRACHIVTLEDPAEYLISSSRALVHQREVGEDVTDFAEGIRESLREDPDVIAIGEMRDKETVQAALMAAETGHLVIATLHNGNAREALGRMIHTFPGEEQKEIRGILVDVLQSVSAQRLWQGEEKTVLLREILWNTPAVSNLIRQGREEQIASYMETGTKQMRTLKQAAYRLKKVTAEERKEILAYIEK